MIRRRLRSSRRTVPTKRSAIALARGARTGVLTIRMSIEGGGELGVSVADEESEAPAGVVEVHEQVAGLLGQPLPGGLGGDAQDVYAAGRVLDDKERVEPVQGDGVEME
jgi:hypothetical protein